MIVNNTFLTEDEYYDKLRMEVLDDNKFMASLNENVFGFTALALLAGFGGAMLAKTANGKRSKVKGFFKRIFGKKKELDFDAIKGKSVAKREEDKAKEFKNSLKDVFEAIDHSDWDEAEKLFKDSKYTENVDAIKAVALAIADKTGEPPLFIYPTGNDTYFLCKKILGMKYAKALAQSVLAALKQNKSYYKDVNDIDMNI